MKRVLMVAYHFPPLTGSSGVQRALRFVSHLPEFGWEPIVLTAHLRVYANSSDNLLAEVPDRVRVIRAQAWDTKRHLSIGGSFPAFLARPDRLRWWKLGAVPAGLVAIRRFKPDAIWSTYPIATAHTIGASLARYSGLPWIADFRDPMAQEGYPADPATWRSFERIERKTLAKARYCTFTSPGALRCYEQRYPKHAAGLELLENGYDDATFAGVIDNSEPLNPGRLTVLHSGIVYPQERDPTQLFIAIRELRARAPAAFEKLVLRFRASVHEDLIRDLARQCGVEGAVEVLPRIGYAEATEEMCRADGLLILQANNCNEQIPAKFYEYLRARRPVLVLADPAGDTAEVARRAGLSAIVALEDASAIREVLERFVAGETGGTLSDAAAVASASRRARTRELARLLDAATGTPANPDAPGNREAVAR